MLGHEGRSGGLRGIAFLTGRHGLEEWDATDSPREEVCLRLPHSPRLPDVAPLPRPVFPQVNLIK